MQIKIKSQNLNLSDSQSEMIMKKVEKLAHFADRLADESSEFRVEIQHEKSRKPADAYVCQLTIFAPHAVIRAETRDESVENAVDACLL
ncbi:ribosome-associated translation inhibitor RaiA, partial [Candidatus Peregrinibacteria bacterium]|nr:ribosome-associated translation inhibitor RaiA [Candidatus Peregrinibacteria bacterium]